MKNSHRIGSLLLAGALSLALFTGCASSFHSQFEDAFMDMVNQKRPDSQETLTNDPVLSGYAQKLLENIVDWETGEIKEDGRSITVSTKMNGKIYTEIILIPATTQDGKYYATEITPEKLQKLLEDNQLGYTDSTYSTYTGVGIATKTCNGKTYYAYGVRYEY